MPNFVDRMAQSFDQELRKIAARKKIPIPAKGGRGGTKALGMAALGAVGFESLRRANNDRKLGRQVRQNQYGQ